MGDLEERFIGWTDVPLSKEGKEEAREVADLLMENEIHP